MVSDPSENEPDEPDEPDPEAEFRDPDSDSLTIPKVSTEDAGSGLRSDLASEFGNEEVDLDVSIDETDVPSELQTAFWALVLVINAAVLAYSLGLMFLIFRGDTTSAAYLVAAGLVLTGFAVRRYRRVKRTDFSSSADDADDESGNESDDGNGPDAADETDDADADGEPDATDGDSETVGESADGTDVPEPSDAEDQSGT